MLSWTPEGCCRRDRPKETWRRTIKRDMRTNELTDEDVESVAANREDWKRLKADPWTI